MNGRVTGRFPAEQVLARRQPHERMKEEETLGGRRHQPQPEIGTLDVRQLVAQRHPLLVFGERRGAVPGQKDARPQDADDQRRGRLAGNVHRGRAAKADGSGELGGRRGSLLRRRAGTPDDTPRPRQPAQIDDRARDEAGTPEHEQDGRPVDAARRPPAQLTGRDGRHPRAWLDRGRSRPRPAARRAAGASARGGSTRSSTGVTQTSASRNLAAAHHHSAARVAGDRRGSHLITVHTSAATIAPSSDARARTASIIVPFSCPRSAARRALRARAAPPPTRRSTRRGRRETAPAIRRDCGRRSGQPRA